MMKLGRLVWKDLKIPRARSARIRSSRSNRSGGKAQYGGQRFGEMEVSGRSRALPRRCPYVAGRLLTRKNPTTMQVHPHLQVDREATIRLRPGAPESFNVLIKEMQSLQASTFGESVARRQLLQSVAWYNKGSVMNSEHSLAFGELVGERTLCQLQSSGHQRRVFGRHAIRWAKAEVKAKTINYRTFKPEKGGLFCEQFWTDAR